MSLSNKNWQTLLISNLFFRNMQKFKLKRKIQSNKNMIFTYQNSKCFFTFNIDSVFNFCSPLLTFFGMKRIDPKIKNLLVWLDFGCVHGWNHFKICLSFEKIFTLQKLNWICSIYEVNCKWLNLWVSLGLATQDSHCTYKIYLRAV